MAPSANGAPAAEPAAEPSIVIGFPGGGLAGVTVAIGPKVTDAQLYAAAWQLDAIAREIRAALYAQAARASLISVPGPDIASLRRSGRV